MDNKPISQQIKSLEEKITNLQDQWPAHSVKPWMLLQLEEWEDELAQLQKDAEGQNAKSSSTH